MIKILELTFLEIVNNHSGNDAPAAYANWWLALVKEDPRHVVVGAWHEGGMLGVRGHQT